MHKQSRDLLDDLGLDIDASAPLTSLGVGQRQMIEIAKAMLSDAWLIVMDEPTSALSQRERDHLFTLVRRLTGRGVAILYISHKMDEVYAMASRAVVLRDGRYVGDAPLPGTKEAELIRMMVGRQIETVFPYVPSPVGTVALQANNLSDGQLLKSATFAVHYGELVVLAGLMGSGRTEVLRCIAGLSPIAAGQVTIAGKALHRRSVLDTMDLAFVPEDRHAEGIIPAMSVEDNLALVWIRDHSPAGLIPLRRQGQLAEEMIQRLNVRPPDRRRLVRFLSGGNQQKVVLGKWLVTDPKIVLLDEPTRGVDVGAKAEIHTLIAQLKMHGIAILMVSSELPEVLGVADRIVVMHQGRSVAELSHGATEEEVMRYALGRQMAEPSVGVGT
jgi:ribose transport system ATP-binding protein